MRSVTAPMTPSSMIKVLFVTGVTSNGDPIAVTLVNAALEELVVAGQAERIWRRGVPVYQALASKQVGYGSTRSS